MGIDWDKRMQEIAEHIKKERDKAMAEVLDINRGSKGQVYEIRRGADNVVYCTCWAWKKHRTCKHLKAWLEKVRPTRIDPLDKLISKALEKLV
jgi:hypothetical protein